MGDEYDRDRMAALSAIYLEPEGSNQVLVVGPRSDDNARFGAYLKTLRDQTGVSRVEAAEQMGLSAEYLRLIEKGARAPAFGQARRMVDAYDGLLVPDIDGYTTDFLPSIPTSDDVGYDMKFTFRGLDTMHVFVIFKSRIREARKRVDVDTKTRVHHRLGSSEPASGTELEDRQRQVGRIIELLVAAAPGTLEAVEQLLATNALSGDS